VPNRPSVEPWPEGLVRDLDDPAAFGATSERVDVRQTHLSRVYLVGSRVYKIPRAVDLGFVSFASRSQRAAECLNEVQINRRLAPDVYLGVAPIRLEAGRWRVGPLVDEAAPLVADLEHCIVMRRLPQGRDALSLLRSGRLGVEQIGRLARRIAEFHRAHGLGRPSPFPPALWRERNEGPIRENFTTFDRAAGTILDAAEVKRLRERTEAALASHGPRFEERRREGRAVDAHGDLHLEHVWFETDDAPPLCIDGIAFREDLRRIDAASELAFLAMDLRYRERPDLAEHWLAGYASARDDYGLYAVVDLYASYRAAVRGKVAALAAMDPDIDPAQREAAAESARRHVAAASAHLEPRPPGPLVLVGGTVGSGKSTLARALAAPGGVPLLASDVLRNVVVGESSGPSRWGATRYSPEARDRVYRAMLERARPVLASGRPVILDATFAHGEHRRRALDVASALGAECWWVEARCAPDTARKRLALRAARGGDASEAGPAHLEASLREWEPLRDWPAGHAFGVETDADSGGPVRDALADRLAARLVQTPGSDRSPSPDRTP